MTWPLDPIMFGLALGMTWCAAWVVCEIWREGRRGEAIAVAAIACPFPVLAVLIAVQLLEVR